MTSAPELVALSNMHAIATWQNVLVQLWEGPLSSTTQAAEFRRVIATLKRMKSRTREPVLVFTVVSVHTTMPDAASRAIAAEMPAWFDYYVGVHEGTGFRASMVRAVVAGMALAARVKARYDVTEDLASGARLLAARSSGVTAPDLLAVVADLRQRVAARPAV